MADLPPPRNISPLIRSARWVALLGGIWYGSSRLASLKQYDAPLRKANIEKATREHEQHLIQKQKESKDSLAYLSQAAGVKL